MENIETLTGVTLSPEQFDIIVAHLEQIERIEVALLIFIALAGGFILSTLFAKTWEAA